MNVPTLKWSIKDKMNIKVISEEKDIKAYYALINKAITEEGQFFRLSPCDMVDEAFPSQNTNDYFTLGAFSEEGELLGTVGFKRDTFYKLQHKGLVFRMYVDSKAKGLGLGRKLLQVLIEKATQNSELRQLYLYVVASNHRAKSLYASEGFEVFATEKGSVRMAENEYVDENMMVKYLC